MGTQAYLSGSRDYFDYVAYVREREEGFKGARAMCSIEILIRGDKGDRVNIYGAYLDSLKNEGMKLSFTTVHDDKNITIHLNTVAKVTINKESK